MSKSQTLKNLLERLAKQVVLLSGEDSVVAIDDGRVLKLARGQYGGWLLREKDSPEMLQGVWCYKTSRRKATQKDVEVIKDVLERVKKVAESVGVRTEPKVTKIAFRYRIVAAKKEKSTDRYTVYEITPTNEEAAASAIRIDFPYKIGKYGQCANDVCKNYGKLKKLIEAEFRGGDALVAGVDVVMPLDTSELEKALAKILGIEEAEEAGAGEGAAEGGGAEGEGGGRRYLVAALPDAVDEEAAVDAVREALKRLGVKNPLVKVIEAEF